MKYWFIFLSFQSRENKKLIIKIFTKKTIPIYSWATSQSIKTLYRKRSSEIYSQYQRDRNIAVIGGVLINRGVPKIHLKPHKIPAMESNFR